MVSAERSLRTGPVSARLTVQPEVQLRIGAGRIDLQVKGELVETAGRTDQLELQVPADLRLVGVDAEGLTDWSRAAADRVRIRFDGAPFGSRAIRLQGWLAVPSDPLAVGLTVQEVSVPWPRWVGVEASPGTLVVLAPSKPQFDANAGVTPVSSEPADDSAGPGQRGALDLPGGAAREPGPPALAG